MRLLAIMASILVATHAIYEDQAGQQDWKRENIGRVRLAAFNPSLSARQTTVYLATDSSVVAALNIRTGSKVWRQVLEGETIEQLVHTGAGVISMANSGRRVHAWSADDGALLWDETLPAASREGALSAVVVLNGDSADVAVLHDDRIQLRDAKNGQLSWTWSAEDKEQVLGAAEGENDKLLIATRGAKGQLTVHTVDVSTGKKTGDAKVLKDAAITTKATAVMAGDSVVVMDSCKVLSHKLGSGKVASTKVDCEAVVSADHLHGKVTVTAGSVTSLYTVGSDSTLKLEHKYAPGALVSAGRDKDGTAHVVSVVVGQQSAQLTIKSGGKAVADLHECPHLALGSNGAVDATFTTAFLKQDGSVGTRVLVATTDHALTLVGSNGDAMWRREEALASTKQVEFVDLPFEGVDMSKEGGSTAMPKISLGADFVKDVRALLKSQVDHAGSAAADYSVTPRDAAAEVLYTDNFQIRKVAIITTAANKVFALNTETAGILWSNLYAAAPQGLQKLAVVRNTGALPPECALVTHTAAGATKIFTFNPLSGEAGESTELSLSVKHSLLLPERTAEFRRVMVLIAEGSNEVSVYPAAADSDEAVKARVSSFFWYHVDKAAGSITGFKVHNGAGKLSSQQTWSMSFGEGEVIDSVGTRSLEETIFAPTYTTGNHDVLYKYLNPNLVAVSTVAKSAPFFKGSKAPAPGADARSSVHLYLIDTVTGHVTYHVAHPQASGPSNVALSENWVAHTYWNDRSLRTELSVVELWEDESKAEDVGTLVFRALGLAAKVPDNKFVKRKHFSNGKNEGKTFSSFTAPPPQKEEQSFIFPGGVKALAVTNTDLGITAKDLLVATSTNQLLAMPRKFFDARRPLKDPTQEEMEEGLMKYHPVLPMLPTNVLTYNQDIAGLRGIRAVPAGGLESTSLVLAYGIDMFFCRSAPSKTFDMLPADFQYDILVVTVLGLSVLTFGISMMSKRKDLNNLWA